MRQPACYACQDKGEVLSAAGEIRPCSRCRAQDFSHWYRDKWNKDMSPKTNPRV